MSNNIDTSSIIQLLESKKAEKIDLYKVGDKVSYADYVIVCQASNKLHNQALAQHVLKEAKGKFQILGKEGVSEGDWILIDLGEVILHCFTPEKRDFFQIDDLLLETTKLLNSKN